MTQGWALGVRSWWNSRKRPSHPKLSTYIPLSPLKWRFKLIFNAINSKSITPLTIDDLLNFPWKIGDKIIGRIGTNSTNYVNYCELTCVNSIELESGWRYWFTGTSYDSWFAGSTTIYGPCVCRATRETWDSEERFSLSLVILKESGLTIKYLDLTASSYYIQDGYKITN